MNVWKWKKRFTEATAHFSEEDLETMRVCPINPQRVVEMWRQHGCRHDRVVPEEVTYNFLPTLNHRTARWFYTPVAGMETDRVGKRTLRFPILDVPPWRTMAQASRKEPKSSSPAA